MSIVMHSVHVTYNHRTIHVWYDQNLCQVQLDQAFQFEDTPPTLLTPGVGPPPSFFSNPLWRQFTLEGCAELHNVSATLRLSKDTPKSLVGLNKAKLSIVCEQEHGTEESSPITQCLPRELRNRTLHSELLVESVWCSLNVDNVGGAQFLKKCHSWGTALYIGVILMKTKVPRVPNTPKLDFMFDTLRFEWSADLCLFLLDVLKCANQYKESTNKCRRLFPPTPLQLKRPPAPLHPPPPDNYLGILVSSVHLTNVNLFYISDLMVCVMCRMDSLCLESGLTKAVTHVEGVKIVSVVVPSTKHQFVCVRCEEVKDAVGYVKQVRIEYKFTGSVNVDFLDHLSLCWSMNLHLKLLTMQQEMQTLWQSLVGSAGHEPDIRPRGNAAHAQLPDRTGIVRQESGGAGRTNKSSLSIGVSVKAVTQVRVAVSPEHSVTFETDSITYSRSSHQDTCWDLPLLHIKIDNSTIFILDSVDVKTMQSCPNISEERKHIGDFVQHTNRAWCWNIKSFKAIFPYEHNFAVAFQNEFISVIKWLRLLHKKPQTGVRPLPADFILKVKEFVFEATDDPFEVKLRDNYELLEDEYKESLKRQKMLDTKLEELYKNNLLIPSAKLEELYANLNAMNSKIYIHRCRQMNTQVTPRTRLFAAVMNDVEILAMSDPVIHGAENVVNIMTEIDQDSPWPEDGVEFSTLWCRAVNFSCREWKFLLRDFPLPWLDIGQMHLYGRLVGAEQEATRRAKRGVKLHIGEPYADITVERSMTSLKFYHDFNCEVERFTYAFGPCWEPVIAQCNLSLEKIFPPSRDPSPPLPLWDKIRLLYHGRLTMIIRQLTLLLHVSLDPYNTTEEMEVTWSDVAMDWTTGKFVYKGDLDVYVRTASKYDDCRLLHFPNLKLGIKMSWLCLGEPHDHHSVMPCAPDKLPEYSSNQEHDSYRAFRSHNVNVSLSLETKPKPLVNPGSPPTDPDCPVFLLYGSTLRWFENLKFILSGVTRPTRRGAAFKNFRPRKNPLSRHYRKFHLLLALHKFQAHYWTSFAMQRGIELISQRITSSSEHTLSLVPVEDGLKHRPRPNWTASYMNCELNDAEVWLKSAIQPDKEVQPVPLPLRQPVEKCYCLSVGKVSYGRETIVAGAPPSMPCSGGDPQEYPPTHRLVVHHLKGAWTTSNRDVVFALFESFIKNQQLKKNLSTAALKSFRASDASSTPLKSRSRSVEGQITPPSSSSLQSQVQIQNTPSPMSKLQSGQAASMLQQLIAEVENKAVVFSDDLSTQTREQHLQGLAACHEDDVVHKNWLIALVNSQVLLKGCETKGYVIVSAAKAEILQRVHRPVWKDRSLVSKTTWIGSLECMQYYATVLAGQNDSLDENILWLSVENIQENNPAGTVISDVPDIPTLVGSGSSVGGVVSETVGASQAENPPLQLQRIVSRCKCEFFYASHDEASITPGLLAEAPPLPSPETLTPWEERERAVDVFTLMHHDLDVCTNSLQYAMILDILNNLLLYVEPKRKEAYEKLQRMRFQLQLHSQEDQRRPIQQLQNKVRCLVAKLRRLERETYLIQRALLEELCDDEERDGLLREMEDLEAQVLECKDQLMSESEELGMMISCYKETQLTAANSKLTNMRNDKPITTVRASEIVFKHAQWRLTQQDGQLGIADLVLSNFLYSKNCKSDDSVEHLLELGYIRMTNLLPNQTYKEVLVPTEIQSNMPIDRKRAIRIFCREKAPVGGISVKEHFEINVVPLTIGLTRKFYQTMLKFCFPERDPENIEDTERSVGGSSSGGGTGSGGGKKGSTSNKESNFYVAIDDVDKMKERAEKNKLFIYIKIPEVPVKLSYKGNKEKNLSDVRDFSLIIPTLEYHNVTWTWLDLLLAMKNDSRRVILSQAIKQKLTINRARNLALAESRQVPAEAEDKAKMLFGSALANAETTRHQPFFKK
uniref:Protein KIAA0100 n=1 Tax=Cacopsylla melanoneura TaxID=428564 RepID=A0A8D9BGK8_9HEMI